eukprot:scaffold50681_cov59-Phaeocystis_antarctica.AAC.2
MPTQVNDSPRAFPKGHMGLKQKMATTQQALGGVAAPSLIAPHTVPAPFRPRTVRPPVPAHRRLTRRARS